MIRLIVTASIKDKQMASSTVLLTDLAITDTLNTHPLWVKAFELLREELAAELNGRLTK